MELNVQIKAISHLTPDIRLFVVESASGVKLPAFTAGSHIDVLIDGIGSRSYSLIDWSAPSASPGCYQFAVQHESQGHGGSTYMHQLSIGQKLNISSPHNNFSVIDRQAPSVLIAGGIGITPMISMAAQLKDQQRSFELHYASRTRARMAFADELQRHYQNHIHLYLDDQNPLNLETLIRSVDTNADIYLCGPQGMIEAAQRVARNHGFEKDQIHIELFSNDSPATGNESFEIQLKSTGEIYAVPPDKSIIDVLEAAGIDLVYDCQRGDCGICQTTVISGIPEHRDVVLSEEEKASGSVMQICVSRARSERLVLDL
jgi:vanillate O-demethylase ferredoxin subunit